MTAATIITGTVFSLCLPIVETGLVDVIVDLFPEDFAFITINVCYPLISIVPITNICCPPKWIMFSLNLLVAKNGLVDFVVLVFDINPSVVVLVIEIVIVFNFALHILVYVVLIGMNLPSTHNYIAKIATTSMTSAKQCLQYNLDCKVNQYWIEVGQKQQDYNFCLPTGGALG